MMIPCRDIAQTIETSLIKEVQDLRAKHIQPKLVTFLLNPTPEQNSFVSIKERVGSKLGIQFELISPSEVPSLEIIKEDIKKIAEDNRTSGIIIQLPLPDKIPSKELYNLIPSEKEIEGHVTNSHFQFPLSLAVLTGLKYVFNKLVDESVIVDFENDKEFFKEMLQNKSIVIAGRGPTGGAPIAKAFHSLGISYVITDSKTENANDIYKNADIIVTATGKKIINKSNIKKGVILLNVGLRKEDSILKGDYDEDEIKDIASFYTETPGGLGPLDVLYLYKNVIDASK